MRIARKQEGFTLVELGIYLAVLAVVGAFVVTQWGNINSGLRVERAYAELERVKTAAEAYRSASANAGLYTNIGIAVLSTNGYNVEPFTTGTNQNTYGLDVTIAAAGSPPATDATLTYDFDNPEDCQQMIQRFDGVTGVKGTPTCSGNDLTVTLE